MFGDIRRSREQAATEFPWAHLLYDCCTTFGGYRQHGLLGSQEGLEEFYEEMLGR